MPAQKKTTEAERLFAKLKRTRAERWADACAHVFGTMEFLLFQILVFSLWIGVNVWSPKWLPAFDPYPFSMLTTWVSLEAIFLSIIVLMSQSREIRVATRREELDLRVNIQAEKEVQELFHVLRRLERKVDAYIVKNENKDE